MIQKVAILVLLRHSPNQTIQAHTTIQLVTQTHYHTFNRMPNLVHGKNLIFTKINFGDVKLIFQEDKMILHTI